MNNSSSASKLIGSFGDLEEQGTQSTDLDSQIHRLVHLVKQFCAVPMAGICIHEDPDDPPFTVTSGLDNLSNPHLCLCTTILLQPDVMVITDTLKDSRFSSHPLVASAPHIRSVASVPLRTATGKSSGAFWVADQTSRTFDSDQLACLRTVGHHLMSCYDLWDHEKIEETLRVQLEAAQTQLREQSQLLALDRDVGRILNQHQDLQTLLQHCADALVHHLQVAFARIWIVDTPTQILELQASAGLYTNLQGRHSHIPVGQLKIGTIAAEQRPHLTNSVIGDPHIHDQEWAKREGMVSFAGYPLLRGNDVLGVMAVFARHPLSPSTLTMLETVANRLTATVECHQTTERLLDFSRQHQLILASAGEGIYGIDREGKTTFINRAASAMLGYEEKELLGRPLHGLIHHPTAGESSGPSDDSAEACPFDAALTNGGVRHSGTEWMWRKDGTCFPVDYTSTPILKDHQLEGAVVTFRDITERRRSEEALVRSEYLLRNIINNTTSVIYVKRTDGRYLMINSQFEKLFHTTDTYMKNKTDYELFPQEIAEAFRRNDLRVITENTPIEIEEQAPHDDGMHTYISVKFPLLDDTGTPYATCGISTDVTKLRRAEEHYRSIFDNAVEGIFQTTPGGRFLMANPSLARMLGYASAEELVTTVTDIATQLYVVPQKREEYQSLLERDGVVRGFEIQNYRKDGTIIWVSVNARAVHDHTGTLQHYEGTLEDITEQKRLAAQLLEETRLAEVTRVLGDIGHDTKNMLMPVMNGVELLQDELRELLDSLDRHGHPRVDASRKLTQELIEMIVNNSRRIQGRVREIADAVKGVTTPPCFAPCTVNSIIDNVLQTLQVNAMKRGITLLTEGLDRLPKIEADTRLLFTAFYNLIDNAIPEVPQGGTVTVRGRVFPESEFLEISVADTGRGLPPEMASRLFKSPIQSHKAGGTGLGTKIIKDAVDAHHGAIQVESTVGIGTTIHVYLPIHEPGLTCKPPFRTITNQPSG